jgi:hypothetical protein
MPAGAWTAVGPLRALRLRLALQMVLSFVHQLPAGAGLRIRGKHVDSTGLV